MTARVLVVDDIHANVRLLQARLTAEYFDVLTASNGPEALELCQKGQCDIVLLDVMMPGMDGFEVCRRLKGDAATAHLPVIMVTALDGTADRVRGLECGADDFITKPVDELALLSRVRSLARLKMVMDELRTRGLATSSVGLFDVTANMGSEAAACAQILLVDDRPSSSERIAAALSRHHKVEVEPDPHKALFRCAEASFELVLISLALSDYDALRLCSQLRALERTRTLAILLIADMEDRSRILRGFDLGVNDYITRPVERSELIARVRTQLRRKRYADQLRNNVHASIEMAMMDALTGLNNRRYLDGQLAPLLDHAARLGRPLSLMVLDIDHFKRVNDTYGHTSGDDVLRAFAQRVRNLVRQADVLCRMGGEEFIVVMPETPLAVASRVAERVREVIEGDLFTIEDGRKAIPVTVSIGLAEAGGNPDAEDLFRRADRALYRSKQAGRNKVTIEANAA